MNHPYLMVLRPRWFLMPYHKYHNKEEQFQMCSYPANEAECKKVAIIASSYTTYHRMGRPTAKSTARFIYNTVSISRLGEMCFQARLLPPSTHCRDPIKWWLYNKDTTGQGCLSDVNEQGVTRYINCGPTSPGGCIVYNPCVLC